MPRMPTKDCRFYVYDLIDPRDWTVFYVGCGTDNRIRDSAQIDWGGVSEGRVKTGRLKAIKSAGLKPIGQIVYSFATRKEALAFEWERQRRFGLPHTPSKPPTRIGGDSPKSPRSRGWRILNPGG